MASITNHRFGIVFQSNIVEINAAVPSLQLVQDVLTQMSNVDQNLHRTQCIIQSWSSRALSEIASIYVFPPTSAPFAVK